MLKEMWITETRLALLFAPKEEMMAVQDGPVIALMDEYELQPALDRGDILPSSVQKALQVLDNKKGFFLMIEGSMIDDGGHDNKAGHTMEEIFDFDRTLGIVLEWAEKDGETLVIVTADHATGGMTLLGGSIQKQKIEGTGLRRRLEHNPGPFRIHQTEVI
mgnify:CR=1 FL=1